MVSPFNTFASFRRAINQTGYKKKFDLTVDYSITRPKKFNKHAPFIFTDKADPEKLEYVYEEMLHKKCKPRKVSNGVYKLSSEQNFMLPVNPDTISGWYIYVELRTDPTRSNKLIEESRDLWKALNISETQAGKGCGLHVHFSLNDKEMMNNRALWLNLFNNLDQDEIYKLFPWRKTNAYAKRIKAYTDIERSVANEDRHVAINCNSINKHCTIELRHAAMTMDFSKVRKYLSIVQKAVETSIKQTFLTSEYRI